MREDLVDAGETASKSCKKMTTIFKRGQAFAEGQSDASFEARNSYNPPFSFAPHYRSCRSQNMLCK
jgi:hypothetical protein